MRRRRRVGQLSRVGWSILLMGVGVMMVVDGGASDDHPKPGQGCELGPTPRVEQAATREPRRQAVDGP